MFGKASAVWLIEQQQQKKRSIEDWSRERVDKRTADIGFSSSLVSVNKQVCESVFFSRSLLSSIFLSVDDGQKLRSNVLVCTRLLAGKEENTFEVSWRPEQKIVDYLLFCSVVDDCNSFLVYNL